ncbi:MAG: hypothetical protein ABI612_21285 [Betaproteobacteria bacterium]
MTDKNIKVTIGPGTVFAVLAVAVAAIVLMHWLLDTDEKDTYLRAPQATEAREARR